MSFLEGIIYMMWRGFAIGVIISAPMGPVGILCVQRTLEKGRQTGFFTGVGASISDLAYCLLTGFGLSFIEDFLKANQNIIQLIGSVVLIIFGIYLFRSNPARQLKKPDAAKTSRRKDILQGFLFTFSNPLIIFLIIGLFARFNFLLPEISFLMYVTGFVFIIAGALFWWWIVSYFVDKVRTHFNLRSMWLINRIIGVVIMVFAIVGVVTAFTSDANAAVSNPIYLNSTRGFGSLGTSSIAVRETASENADGADRKPLLLSNNTSDTVSQMIPCHIGGNFILSFRAFSPSASRSWGIALKSGNQKILMGINADTRKYDEPYSPSLTITTIGQSGIPVQTVVNSGINAGGENSYRLTCADGLLSLGVGNHRIRPVLNVALAGIHPDSVGFMLAPGASLILDEIVLEETSGNTYAAGAEMSHFGNPDVRLTYFARSIDDMEGEWEIFDRTFDDSCLRPGGAYRLALVRSQTGYCMVYLAGAQKNAGAWQPGATKGTLRSTSFAGVYDVDWLDPAGCSLGGEIKAQFSANPPMLTLHFVDHNSTLRLRKVEK